MNVIRDMQDTATDGDRPVRALVADDEATIRDFLGTGFDREGFTVETVQDGPAALAAAARSRPDVVILAAPLPGLDGIAVCRRLRARDDLAIVLLTAHGAVDERIVGLEAGADDCLPQPFRFQELLARVRAVLRGRAIVPRRVLHTGDLLLDRGLREVTRHGHRIALTPREFALLALLLAHPGQVVPRETILSHIWGQAGGGGNALDVHIGTLRAKLGDKPKQLLQTVHGVGYVLRT